MENLNEVLEVGEVVQTIETVETDLNDIETVETENKAVETVEIEPAEMEVEKQPEVTEPIELTEQLEAENENAVPILKYSEIKSFRYENHNIQYAEINGEILLCGYDFLKAVFSKQQIYHQLAELEKMGIDAELQGSEKYNWYCSIEKVEKRLNRYEIAPATYQKQPENFEPYIRFVANGGMNQIALILGIEPNFKEPKDLFYLGVNILDFANPSTDKQPENKQPAENTKAVESKGTTTPEKQPENTTPMQSAVTDKRLLELSAKIEKQSKNIEGVLNAFEANKAANESNFKQFESAFNQLSNAQNVVAATVENILNAQMQFEGNLSGLNAKIETVEKRATEIQTVSSGKEHPNRLKKLLTDQSVWMYLAMVVTAIFLPFTIMGLYKHIHISTDTWYSALSVGFLCCAIAFVWDMAIFFFAINGKKGMAAFGSLVQVVFFSAKFNLIAILAQDGLGLVGEYWQNLTCIIFAVIYSPLLLANLTHLSVSTQKEKE